jgi:hypothetical protein
MGLIRSVLFGIITWVLALEMMIVPETALGLAIVVAFLSESTHHRSELRRMHRHSNGISNQLSAANHQVEELQRALTRRHVELNTAIDELQRRDAVGSPAARELLKRQEEAMNTVSRALEIRHERNDVVFNSMERLLNLQVEQTANLQMAMAELLQHLISQPRGHFTMNDSVLVSDSASGNDTYKQQMREINAWLKEQAASSP